MHPRYRPWTLLLGLLAVFAVARTAFAVDRYDLQHGQSYTGEALLPGEFDEYVLQLARGSTVALSFGKAPPSGLRPGIDFINDNYQRVGVIATGVNRLTSTAIQSSGRYRFLIGGVRDTVGGYRLKAVVRPARTFVLKVRASDARQPRRLDFGSYAGLTTTITLKWKGETPLTATLGDPAGDDVALPEPVAKKGALIFKDVPTETFGTYALNIEVPEDTIKWSAKVRINGSLPRGEARDVRTGPRIRTLDLVTRGFLVNPVVVVRGEYGGPNEIGLTGSLNGPEPQLPDATVRCGRSAVDGARPSREFRLRCSNGLTVEVRDLERDEEGRATRYEAVAIRGATGRGSASIRDLTYDERGLPATWTEIRRFATTGRVHELHFSDVDRFANGVLRGYRVEHVRPDGSRATYEYAPITLPNQ